MKALLYPKWILFLILIFTFVSNGKSHNFNMDSLKTLVEGNIDDTLKVILLNKMAYEYHRTDASICGQLGKEALEISNKINYGEGIAKSYKTLGLHYVITDDYINSLNSYNKTLEYYQQVNDKVEIANTLSNIGIVFELQYDYNSALDYFLKALEILEKDNYREKQAAVLGNLGNLYDQQNEYQKAMDYYSKALVIFEEFDQTSEVANVYRNLGLVYLNQNKYSEAENYFQMAIEIDSSLNNNIAQSDNLGNLALTYYRKGEYNMALVAYQKALELDEKLQNLDGIAFDLKGFSSLYLILSRDTLQPSQSGDKLSVVDLKKQYLNRALDYALKAEEIYSKIDQPSFELYNTLKEIYLDLPDLKQALKYQELYWETRNDRFSSQKAKEFARLEGRHQQTIDKNKILLLESESAKNYAVLISVCIILLISLLAGIHFYYQLNQKRLINSKLEQLNLELNQAVASKDKFFSIIAHDLINPIGGIYTALKVFRDQKDDLSNDEQKEYLHTLVKSASNASNLLTNLLEWARIQKGSIEFNPTPHSINSILKSNIQLTHNLAASKRIKVTFQKSENIELECDDYMLNSLFGNLLSNAIKFTNNEGSINIRAEKAGSNVVVIVEDNGIGIDAQQIEKLFDVGNHFNQPGTNNEKGTGLGLILCKEFVDFHSGKIDIESTLDQGTIFKITLPETQA